MGIIKPINALWIRWIYASMAKHLHEQAAAGSLEIKVDFTDGESSAWKAAVTKAQATITGPLVKNRGHGEIDVVVSVFVTVTSDRSLNDYDHIDATGVMTNALDQCVTVIDYGATGVLEIGQIFPGRADADLIEANHLRPIKTDDQIFSTISARYQGTFTE